MVSCFRHQRDRRWQKGRAVRNRSERSDDFLQRRPFLTLPVARRPKIAANDRAKATPEEAQAIVASAIAYYGTYSIDEASKVMSVKLEASTFANVAAIPNQKRIITALTADEFKFSNPRTPSGMTLLTVWKRAAAP